MRHTGRSCVDRLCDHLCCRGWRLALIVPLLHLALHFLGVPHSESVGLLP